MKRLVKELSEIGIEIEVGTNSIHLAIGAIDDAFVGVRVIKPLHCAFLRASLKFLGRVAHGALPGVARLHVIERKLRSEIKRAIESANIERKPINLADKLLQISG